MTLLSGLTFWPQHSAMFADSAAEAGVCFALYVSWAVPLAIVLGRLLRHHEPVLQPLVSPEHVRT